MVSTINHCRHSGLLLQYHSNCEKPRHQTSECNKQYSSGKRVKLWKGCCKRSLPSQYIGVFLFGATTDNFHRAVGRWALLNDLTSGRLQLQLFFPLFFCRSNTMLLLMLKCMDWRIRCDKDRFLWVMGGLVYLIYTNYHQPLQRPTQP